MYSAYMRDYLQQVASSLVAQTSFVAWGERDLTRARSAIYGPSWVSGREKRLALPVCAICITSGRHTMYPVDNVLSSMSHKLRVCVCVVRHFRHTLLDSLETVKSVRDGRERPGQKRTYKLVVVVVGSFTKYPPTGQFAIKTTTAATVTLIDIIAKNALQHHSTNYSSPSSLRDNVMINDKRPPTMAGQHYHDIIIM